MANINGVIQIDFDTENPIIENDKDKFNAFKCKLQEFLEDHLEMAIFEIACECGLNTKNYFPVILDELEIEFDEKSELE